MDGLVVLSALGIGFAVWFLLAMGLARRGKGWLSRNLIGAAAGLSSLFVVVGLADAIGLIDTSKRDEESVRSTSKPQPSGPATEAALPPPPASVPPQDPPAMAPTDLVVSLDFTPPAPSEPVRIHTNLPSGTDLMVTVSEKGGRGDTFQDKTRVSEGSANAGPFGRGGSLPDGLYEIEVLMPIAEVQNEEVRTRIGAHGERLKGPLVSSGEHGIIVRRTIEFPVGTASIEEAERKAKLEEKALLAKAKGLLQNVIDLEIKARAMDGPRVSNIGRCGELMRQLQPIAERLRDEANELPMHLFGPGAAAGHLVLGCSCLNSAPEHRALALKIIAETKERYASM